MHSAALLRNHFQRFSDWVNKGRQDERAALSEFLFRATSASLALGEMRFREQRCVQQFRQFKEHLTLKRKRIVFASLDLFQLFHQFTPFMSAIRVLQNMLLRMVGRRLQLGTSIPNSLNDAIPKIATYKLPEKVVEQIVGYWESGGSRLKSYRDVDLHHFALSKQSFLEWHPEERIIIVLPDNPEIKAESKLTFTGDIDAIRYFGQVFDSFHRLVEDVCAELGFTPADMKEELTVEHFGSLEDGVKQTIALWMDDADASRALEVGQLEDRRLYFHKRDSRKLLP
jgi:hypothetical protein